MEINEFRNLFEKYASPTFVFDTASLKKRVQKIREIIGEKVHLCYSIKANPFLVSPMLECVDKLEVCSPGEMSICEHIKVPENRIIYSGVNKTIDDIRQAVIYNAGTYTAESLQQVEYLDIVGREEGKILPVLLRLSSANQFGMSKEDLMEVIEKRDSFVGIEIVGIHYFAGTQRKKSTERTAELLMLKELFKEIQEKYNFCVQKLEYGPGLPVPYFANEDFTDTLAPIEQLAPELKEMAECVDLTIEMGRFFVSECGYYFTKVMEQKENNGINYCILDGGMNHLNYYGQMMGMKLPLITHIKQNKENSEESGKKKWCLCGSLCTTADVVVREAEFESLNLQDVLVFKNVGAYSVTEGVFMFLSRKMPRIVLYHGNGKTELIRDYMETYRINCKGES